MKAGKTKFKHKVFLIAGGICLTLLLLETGLRAGGSLYTALQEYRNQRALKQKDVYRIVCLGESTTANGGENAYPYQLERILNKLNPGIPFSVINKGMPGRTSPEIVVHLEDVLDQYQPQMVITMIGINDTGGVLVYQDYRNDKLWVLIKSLRIYKLACLLKEHIKAKISERTQPGSYAGLSLAKQQARELPDGENLKKITQACIVQGIRYVYHNDILQAVRIFEKAVGLDASLRSEAYAYWGWCYRMDNQLSKAEEVLKKAVEIDPKNSFAYQELGQCYMMKGQRPLYEEMLKKAIEVDPDDYSAYQRLALYYMLENPGQSDQPWLEKALALKPDDERFLGRLGSFYMAKGNVIKAEEFFQRANRLRLVNYNPSAKESYRKIKESVLKRGIKLVCAQYPVRSLEPLKKILDYDDRIIFVDNELIFKKALEKDGYKEYFTDTFAGDFGHCTPKGNALLAGNIARAVAKLLYNPASRKAGDAAPAL